MGRLVGELLCSYGSEFIVSTPGSYALIGAVSDDIGGRDAACEARV